MKPQPSPALFTDLYELTMAQAYWQSGRNGPATFSLFVRKLPPDRGYLVFAGLADVLDYLERLHFTPDDIDCLRALGRFDNAFLDWLPSLRFTGSVRAMKEGTLCFGHEPMVEVTGPLIETQLVETFLLNQVNMQTLLATKAARVRHAARDLGVVDFAARRTHGVDAANKFARVSYLAGFDATSNTQAGALYGIPVSGTMAHSFITSYPSELESFRDYARSFPDACTLLVDTYDTLAGVRNAIIVAQELRAQGHGLQAVRLDSGDLAELARSSRQLFDDAGFRDVRIVVSGGLDEHDVDALVRGGAPIDAFGVGTRVGVSADAPWTDAVYKLVEYDSRPVLKLSLNKQTLPGPKQVFRALGHDIIACADETPVGEPLLTEVMRDGKRIGPEPTLADLRTHCRAQLAALRADSKVLRRPAPYEVKISDRLRALEQKLVHDLFTFRARA